MKRAITNLFRPAFRLLGIPIHPITIIMFVCWGLGVIGAAAGQEWMVWIMAVLVGLVVIFWLWVRFYPLRYDQMTDREKNYSEQLPHMTLKQAIANAKPNLDKITDVDKHLDDIR